MTPSPTADARAVPSALGDASRALAYAQRKRTRFVSELADFVRFPSVSAEPRHSNDVVRCARWLADHLRAIGLDAVRVVVTAGHPIVDARWDRAPGRSRVLVYGHYDVQPPDPLDEWRSPPFQPDIRGDRLYGRGASDDKGQLFAHIKALESFLRTTQALPVNVRCLFEGEEEIGSRQVLSYLSQPAAVIDADAAVLSDTAMLAHNRPAITESLRGALSVELEVRGPAHDLHSGTFGGAVHNPLQVLCDIISRLHDTTGRIAIPGFYDKVHVPSRRDRQYMAGVGPSDAQITQTAAIPRAWGEAGFTSYERTTIRPAISVNGISGGYQGPGAKAIVPARATAKLNVRLVPDQDPHEIDRQLRAFVTGLSPPSVQVSVRTLFGAYPAAIDRTHPAVAAARLAYRAGFGTSPVFLRSGGTIPIVPHLARRLGIPTVLMGFGLPDDRIHAPNESVHLPTFGRAIDTSIHFLSELGRVAAESWPTCERSSEARTRRTT